MYKIILFILFLLSFITVSNADITSNLVGWWTFDETSGTSCADSSGNGNTGTNNSATILTPSNCKINSCLSFNGSSSYVNVGTGTSLNITGDLTVSVWEKSTVGGLLIGFYQDGSPYVGWGMDLDYPTNHKMGFYSHGCPACGVGGWVNGNTSVDDGNFHNYTITLSGTTVTFYVDGNNDGTATSASPDSFVSTKAVGAVSDGLASYFSGTIDEVRIYTRALSSTDVSQLYAYTGATHSNSISGTSKITGVSLIQ